MHVVRRDDCHGLYADIFGQHRFALQHFGPAAESAGWVDANLCAGSFRFFCSRGKCTSSQLPVAGNCGCYAVDTAYERSLPSTDHAITYRLHFYSFGVTGIYHVAAA